MFAYVGSVEAEGDDRMWPVLGCAEPKHVIQGKPFRSNHADLGPNTSRRTNL
jgi:hypothetical protein